jgi:two-component system, LytTR family, response regulator
VKPIRVAIADDERLARLRLRRILSLRDDVEIVGEYENGSDLLRALETHSVDLVLLDIEMPEFSGFATIKKFASGPPLVVFVTAYAQYAVNAFEVDALDYLVKPVSEERLAAMVAKVKRALRQRDRETRGDSTPVDRIPLPIGKRTVLVEIEHIDCVLAQANYIEFRVGTKTYVLRKPLTWIETRLDPRHFVRIHRSTIVRVASIVEGTSLASGRYRLRLQNGLNVNSGRRYRDRVRTLLDIEGGTDE